jgi:hypothetical protein
MEDQWQEEMCNAENEGFEAVLFDFAWKYVL